MIRVVMGDIGGTKTRLAVAEVAGEQVRIERMQEYRSAEHSGLEAMLEAFLHQTKTPLFAAFGVAGPVSGDSVHITNLPWRIEAAVVRQRFGFRTCALLNDLEATAHGIPALADEDLVVLQHGDRDACGNAAVIAAGTGLGEAGLYWDGHRHHPFATEGGHATFSPQGELEYELLRYLQRRHAHVSWERVVSGMGLLDLHQFLCSRGKSAEPQWLATEMQDGDAAAAIARAALAGSDDICIETLRHFVRLYGAEAGNLALKTMSRGGLYVGGGIAPKILPLLQHGGFMDAFLAKGRMRPLLKTIPVRVIRNDLAALYGAAIRAARAEHA